MRTPFLPPSDDSQKKEVQEWHEELQKRICTGLELLEKEHDPQKSAFFQKKKWERPGGGGGHMAILEGTLFEKAGVNTSTVFGEFSPEFASHIPGAQKDRRFWASGVSLVIHPRSPHVPIIHMNTRHIVTTTSWFGGGIDLTPPLPNAQETEFFHETLQKICNAHDPLFYPEFKKWADDYFFIKHRNEPRGIGGIFYDYLGLDTWEQSKAFHQDLGEIFLPLYSDIVRKKWTLPWGENERRAQLKKRARYVEFNLVYDRGTLFGLKTDGYIDAILMSLPPMATWPSPFSESE